MKPGRANHRTVPLGLWLVASALLVNAAQPWSNKDYKQWTPKDIEQLLSNSPWAKQAQASFGSSSAEEDVPAGVPLPGPPQAGMADRRGASDGRWDGGVSRNVRGSVPSLRVLVRWDSALPIREALLRSGAAAVAHAGDDYIITVIGLLPASGAKGEKRGEMLKELISASALVPRGKSRIRPSDVQLEASTGTLHFLFPRAESIRQSDKEVTFATQFGSIGLTTVFRLKEMTYNRELEL